MSCPLCELKEKKVIHKETHEFIIIDCASCDVPMIVWKAHTMEPGDEELEVMEKELRKIGNDIFRPWKYFIDRKQGSVFDHIHWHARPNKHRWRKFYENTADGDIISEDA